jgi:serine/threonine protein kinase
MENLPEIPGYRIERELGQGGMATVYLAVQEKLNRKVAVKVLSPLLLLDRNFISRFLKEAETAANLNHSGIVSIYDVGQEGNTNYIVMEFLEKRLRDLYAPGRPMEPYNALNVVRQVATALGYAHQRGFIHRDIKPDNIMFRGEGIAVLTDFGIARAVDSATKLTKTGMSIGTPHYMSPEQARGHKLDGRSDLYSLGVVLFEMLTGSVPFDGDDSISIGIKHVQEPVPRLRAALAPYQSLLDKLLAKNPQDRPQSGKELAELIDDLLDENAPARRPSFSRTPTPPWGVPPVRERKQKTAPQSPIAAPKGKTADGKRKHTIWVLAGLLSVLLVVLLVIVMNKPEKTQEFSPIDQGISSGQSGSQGEINTADSEYARYFAEAKTAYEQGKHSEVLRLLAQARTFKTTDESALLEKLVHAEIEHNQQTQAEQQHQAQLEEQRQQNAKAARLHEEAAIKQKQEEKKKQQEAEAEAARLREEAQKKEAEERVQESSRYASSSASLHLRSTYLVLSDDDAKAMIKRWNISDKIRNASGQGIIHQYESRKIDGDRVVIDGTTGLMWHQSGSKNILNYGDSLDWLEDLNRRGYAGYSNWRLPTLEEGASLMESSQKNDNLYIDPVFSKRQSWILTGDTLLSGALWVVFFAIKRGWKGNIWDCNVGWLNKTDSYFVRPVRSER